MKTTVNIEQYDNGYALRWETEGTDPECRVVYDHDAERQLGQMLLDDIKHAMDGNLTNSVEIKMEITKGGAE